MSFDYNPELTDELSQVRFELGDTTSASAMLSDEEINAKIASCGSVLGAAADLADSLAARFARRVSISIDGASWQYGQLASSYAALAQRLRSRATIEDGGLGRPVVTGTSISEMQQADEDTDRVPSQFKLGQFDNTPREGGGDIGEGEDTYETP